MKGNRCESGADLALGPDVEIAEWPAPPITWWFLTHFEVSVREKQLPSYQHPLRSEYLVCLLDSPEWAFAAHVLPFYRAMHVRQVITIQRP